MPETAPRAASSAPTSPGAKVTAEFSAIEGLLLGTPGGRWFLAEYARRNRTADTAMLLEAITKLELAALRPQRRHQDRVLSELVEMREAIERTRREIAAIKPPNQLLAATEELDHIVEATEKATSEILQAAEEIQEVGWILREKGAEAGLCDTLDHRATDIYTACSFQDITGQRTGKMVKVLRFIEQRINAVIEIWGAEDIGFTMQPAEDLARAGGLLNGPQGDGAGLKQDDIDVMLTIAETGVAPKAAVEPGPPAAARQTAAPGEALATLQGSPARIGTAVEYEGPERVALAKCDAARDAVLFG
jgi:chemotaxis protein CheZ